jgi:hypothetical protein
VLTLGVDPNWQAEKLGRLIQALQLAKERREQRRLEQERKAQQRMQLILSAADRNPNALASPTVRRFVEENQAIIPGLKEWHDLEVASLTDPNSPRNAYNKLLSGADQVAEQARRMAEVPAAGFWGRTVNMAGRLGSEAIAQDPTVAFDAAAKQLPPSQRVRATEFAKKSGAVLPLSDPGERNAKVSGPLYVLTHPEQYPAEVVEAARIELKLKLPVKEKNDEAQLQDDYLYVVEHPDLFSADTVKAARIHLHLEPDPTKTEKPEVPSNIYEVLNNPGAYSPHVVRYAFAQLRKAEREPKEGGSDDGSKGRLTEGQAYNDIDDYLADFYQRFGANGLTVRHLTPNQRRKAADLLRSGGDVDTFIVNTLLPVDGRSLKRVVNAYLRRSKIKQKGAAQRIEQGALNRINDLKDAGWSHAAARARVLLDVLEEPAPDKSEEEDD